MDSRAFLNAARAVTEPDQARPKCRVKLPNPKAAGYTTKEALLEAVKKYPHLRPCPKRDWWWIEWKTCERCDWNSRRRLSGSFAAFEQKPCGA